MKIFFNTFKLFKDSFSFDQIHNTYQLAYFLFENMKMKSLLQVFLFILCFEGKQTRFEVSFLSATQKYVFVDLFNRSEIKYILILACT